MANFNISKITTELNKTQQKKISSLPSIEIVKSSNSISLFGTNFSKDTSINIPLNTKTFLLSQFTDCMNITIFHITKFLYHWHKSTEILTFHYSVKLPNISCGNAIVICYVVRFIFFLSLIRN